MKPLNRRAAIAGILGLTMILSSACSASGANEAASSTSSNTEKTTASAQTSGQSSAANTTGDHKTFKRPDVIGEVKSIIGNSVTIALAKMPERTLNSTSSSSSSGASQGQPPAGGPPADGGGGPPSGSSGSGTGRTSSGSGSGSGSANRSFSLTLTGETKEILIPVGVEITSGNGKNAKTIDIADIKKGNTIMIYYVEGSETIEKVTVR